ncbi:MAG: TonB-dependent receptor [bacterium]|nr:TonB-dependent receptor [bacterium]
MKMIFCLIFFLFSVSLLQAGVYSYNDSLGVFVTEGTVVSATKLESPIEDIGKCMTIITREDIERSGDIAVLEALRNFPSLHVIRKGTFGGYTEVHSRGGKSGFILVLIDGIKVNDPTSSDRSFDWGTLSTSAVERIEIIRGSQCALYGSDAINGVINIITRKGEGGIKAGGKLWAFPYNTFSEQAGISGGTKGFDYSVSLLNVNSRGVSKALTPDSQPAIEKDGYANREAYTKITTYPFRNLSVGMTGGYRDSKVDVDAGPFKDDSNAITYFTSRYGKLFINHKVASLWNYKLTVAVNNVDKKDENVFDMGDTTKKDGSYEGDYTTGEFQNNFTVNKNLNIVAGFEYGQESMESCNCRRSAPQDTVTMPHSYLFNRSSYIEFMPNYKNFFFTLSGRIDNYEDFGSYKTWQASMSFFVNSTKFKSNYGIGFKMPSVYQLFSPKYGNANLIPEVNRSFDVGGEHRFKDGVIEIIYYNLRVKNSIDLLDKYKNREKSLIWCTEGMEFYFLLYVLKDLSTDLSFTGLDKINAPEDYLLLPSLDYKWSINYKWLNVKFCCIGKRQDKDYLSGLSQLVDVRSCSRINITDSFKFKKITIQLKVENLIDDTSMEAAGYTELGRGFCVGISY